MALINYITQVQIDYGVLALLPQECARAGIRKPLVVSDAGVRAAGLLDRALAAIGAMPHAVFDATPSNPNEAAVRLAVAVYLDNGCDGLVGDGSNASLGLPLGLAALGVTSALYERIVDGAMADHCHKTNPRIATRDDYVRMLEDSM